MQDAPATFSWKEVEHAFVNEDISLEQFIEVLIDNLGRKKTKKILKQNLKLAIKLVFVISQSIFVRFCFALAITDLKVMDLKSTKSYCQKHDIHGATFDRSLSVIFNFLSTKKMARLGAGTLNSSAIKNE